MAARGRSVEVPRVRIRTIFGEPTFEIDIAEGGEIPYATALDLSQAIYDFSLAYEIAVMRSLKKYSAYSFANFFLLGRKRPVPRKQRLRVEHVSYESPFHFLSEIPPEVLWWAGAGGGVVFLRQLVEVLEKVYTIPVNFKNARLRAEVENARLRKELKELEGEPEDKLQNRVRREHFQPTSVDIESDDWPMGLS